MRKITFLLGAGIGFVAGSKAGNGPYQQLESKVREVTKRPRGPQSAYEPASDSSSRLAGPAPAPVAGDVPPVGSAV